MVLPRLHFLYDISCCNSSNSCILQPSGDQYGKENQKVEDHLIMNQGEVFVDVGANVGSHSLRIAHDYADIGVRVKCVSIVTGWATKRVLKKTSRLQFCWNQVKSLSGNHCK
jgi:hypothetical protein